MNTLRKGEKNVFENFSNPQTEEPFFEHGYSY